MEEKNYLKNSHRNNLREYNNHALSELAWCRYSKFHRWGSYTKYLIHHSFLGIFQDKQFSSTFKALLFSINNNENAVL